MCTYDTERITVTGSAKGADGWFRATDATISYDHPTLRRRTRVVVDLINPALGASSRVGLELTRNRRANWLWQYSAPSRACPRVFSRVSGVRHRSIGGRRVEDESRRPLQVGRSFQYDARHADGHDRHLDHAHCAARHIHWHPLDPLLRGIAFICCG